MKRATHIYWAGRRTDGGRTEDTTIVATCTPYAAIYKRLITTVYEPYNISNTNLNVPYKHNRIQTAYTFIGSSNSPRLAPRLRPAPAHQRQVRVELVQAAHERRRRQAGDQSGRHQFARAPEPVAHHAGEHQRGAQLQGGLRRRLRRQHGAVACGERKIRSYIIKAVVDFVLCYRSRRNDKETESISQNLTQQTYPRSGRTSGRRPAMESILRGLIVGY